MAKGSLVAFEAVGENGVRVLFEDFAVVVDRSPVPVGEKECC